MYHFKILNYTNYNLNNSNFQKLNELNNLYIFYFEVLNMTYFDYIKLRNLLKIQGIEFYRLNNIFLKKKKLFSSKFVLSCTDQLISLNFLFYKYLIVENQNLNIINSLSKRYKKKEFILKITYLVFKGYFYSYEYFKSFFLLFKDLKILIYMSILITSIKFFWIIFFKFYVLGLILCAKYEYIKSNISNKS